MVSVIIPVYNGESYIERCLNHLFAEVTDSTSLEVIAVNDGSRDNSSALLHTYAERFPSLRVIDKENAGAASARKDGIAAARGEYIAFLDIDDWVESSMYAKLEQKAVQSDADIVVCNYTLEYPSHSRIQKNKFKKGQPFPMSGEEAIRYLHRRQAIFPFPWNKLYRAELLRTVSFPTGNFVGEDYNMLLQLFAKSSKIDYLDFEGYHYVQTENSASRSGYGESTVRAYNHFKEDYTWVCEHYPHMKKDVTHYLMIEYMACIVAMGRNNTYNKGMIQEVKRFVRRGLFGFLLAGYVSPVMKGSALALSISYRLLIAMYRILN